MIREHPGKVGEHQHSRKLEEPEEKECMEEERQEADGTLAEGIAMEVESWKSSGP